MATKYTVEEGDCVVSIAFRNGLHPDTLWNAPENAELRARRVDRHVLAVGDEIFVPSRRSATAELALDRVHRFRRRAVPETLRIQLVAGDRPRAGLRFELHADAVHHTGTTDAHGTLTVRIRPDAHTATLRLPDFGEVYEVAIGSLAPISELRGVHERLSNLGLLHATTRELAPHALRDALLAFQRQRGLEPSGALDDATRDALEEAHRANV